MGRGRKNMSTAQTFVLRLCDGDFFRVSCQLVTSRDDCRSTTAYLTNLIVHSEMDRGHGWATHLLNAVRKWLIARGCTSLHLDDCSDAYRQPHNVYLHVGATYDQETGPEMTWSFLPYPTQEGEEGEEAEEGEEGEILFIVTEVDT